MSTASSPCGWYATPYRLAPGPRLVPPEGGHTYATHLDEETSAALVVEVLAVACDLGHSGGRQWHEGDGECPEEAHVDGEARLGRVCDERRRQYLTET